MDLSGCLGRASLTQSTKQHPRQTLDTRGMAGAGRGMGATRGQDTHRMRGPPTPHPRASSHAEPQKAGQLWKTPSLPAVPSSQPQEPGGSSRLLNKGPFGRDQSAPGTPPSLSLIPCAGPSPLLLLFHHPADNKTAAALQTSIPPSAWQPPFRGTQRGLQPQPLRLLPAIECLRRQPGQGPPALLQASQQQETVAPWGELTPFAQASQGLSWRWLQPTAPPGYPKLPHEEHG